MHEPDSQSGAYAQRRPSAHLAQPPPPQSTSDSSESFIPLRHLGGTGGALREAEGPPEGAAGPSHRPFTHDLETQSDASSHAWPPGQAGHAMAGAPLKPPQSVPVSRPFFAPSKHVVVN